MSESRSTNSVSTEASEEFHPSVCIASSGKKRDLKCNYDNVHFVFSGEEGRDTPDLFNSFLNNREFDVYVFISKDYDFTNENSIDDILNALFGYNSSQVDAVYSDILINIKGRQTPLKSQRTASKNLLLSNEILNIPFAVKQHALPKFKDQFKHLFLHMGILECFQNCLIIHCPKFCFSVNNISPSNAELIKEMEMLKDGKQ